MDYMKKTKRTLKKFGLNALVWREGDLFVAKSVEVLVASQGKTVQQALKNLEEALELYFEDEKIPAEKITLFPSLRLEKLFPKIVYA